MTAAVEALTETLKGIEEALRARTPDNADEVLDAIADRLQITWEARSMTSEVEQLKRERAVLLKVIADVQSATKGLIEDMTQMVEKGAGTEFVYSWSSRTGPDYLTYQEAVGLAIHSVEWALDPDKVEGWLQAARSEDPKAALLGDGRKPVRIPLGPQAGEERLLLNVGEVAMLRAIGIEPYPGRAER